MARVDISLNGRSYPIACDDGQEDRVREVAGYVDEKIAEIRGMAPAATDQHLLVMASLMIADELLDTSGEIERLRASAGNGIGAATGNGLADDEQAAVAQALGRLAGRLEDLAGQLTVPAAGDAVKN
jgi:cell division protein ZapA